MITFEEACRIAKKEMGKLYPIAHEMNSCWVFSDAYVEEFPIGSIPLRVDKKDGKPNWLAFGSDDYEETFKNAEKPSKIQIPENLR